MSAPVRIGPLDRVTIGVPLRLVREVPGGHVLCRVDDPDFSVSITHEEFAAAQKRPDFRYEPDFFDAGRAGARVVSGTDHLFEIARSAQQRTADAWGWASDFLELEREQRSERPKEKERRVARSDAGMARAIRIIVERRAAGAEDARRETPDERLRKPRAGSEALPTSVPPGVKTLRKYVKLLETHGCPTVLRQRTDLCRGQFQVSLECEAVMARVARRFMSETRPTKKGLYLDLKLEIADANARLAPGVPRIDVPSLRTFSRRIKRLPAFAVHAARFGLKAAAAKFPSVTQGLGATRPGEMVLMDDLRVPVQLVFVQSGIWESLSDKEKKLVERLRPWLCLSVCAATRCMLSMSLSRDQSTDSVLATLRMTMTDKRAYADAVGALSAWDMAVTPEVVMTDAGSNFIANPVRAALAGLRIVNRTGPASRPVLRALVERVFGTIHTQLFSRFTGRTFANTVLKGDYDPEARASLDVDDLSFALVRYAVDMYHNTPHEGLGGETPANCWRRLTKLYPPRPLPDRHTMRAVFGFDVRRRTGPRGVRILGLHYQGEAVQTHRRRLGDGQVTVRVDEMDVGSVSILLEDGWATLRCVTPHLDGVSLVEWTEAAKALRRRHARVAVLTESHVLEAVRAMQRLSERGLARFGLGQVRPSQAAIDQTERALDIGWTMPGSETPVGDDADLFSGGIPSQDPGTDHGDAAPSADRQPTPFPDAPDASDHAAVPPERLVAGPAAARPASPARGPRRRPGPPRHPTPPVSDARIVDDD